MRYQRFLGWVSS